MPNARHANRLQAARQCKFRGHMERSELNPQPVPRWSWRDAEDAAEVHVLLCASDAFHAGIGQRLPQRNPRTTEAHVQARAVQGLFHDDSLVAMVTLTTAAPRGMDTTDFGLARQALYMQRLAVDPAWLGRDALLGVRCVKHALGIARKRGAEVLRAEANPRLAKVMQLLRTFGFVQVGPVLGAANGTQRVNMQCEVNAAFREVSRG